MPDRQGERPLLHQRVNPAAAAARAAANRQEGANFLRRVRRVDNAAGQVQRSIGRAAQDAERAASGAINALGAGARRLADTAAAGARAYGEDLGLVRRRPPAGLRGRQ